VEVNRRALLHIVGDVNSNLVALGDANLGTWHNAVVGPCLDRQTRRVLPLDDIAGEIEDLDVPVQGELERQPSLALGLGREQLDTRLVMGIHLIRRHFFGVLAGGRCRVVVVVGAGNGHAAAVERDRRRQSGSRRAGTGHAQHAEQSAAIDFIRDKRHYASSSISVQPNQNPGSGPLHR
jgi:hypothetical protein